MQTFLTVEVDTAADRIETFVSQRAGWSVVLLSHSLYGYLENPRLADEERRQRLTEIAEWVAPDGVLLISLASSSSQAYDTKRRLLDHLGRDDLSRFGEDLVSMLRAIGLKFRMEVAHSYMDVTELVNGKDRDLVAWISYFCRVPRRLLPSSKVQELRAIVRKSAVRFGDIAQELQKQYKAFPCDLGTPDDATLVLQHRECYIVANA